MGKIVKTKAIIILLSLAFSLLANIGKVQSQEGVKLASISASRENGEILLNWTTDTEVNNFGFEIERTQATSDSTEWVNIGFVLGNGDCNSPNEYSFVDSNPLIGSASYRIKQIDTDGKYSYSSVVTPGYRL